LIDSHCHINDPKFDGEVDQIVNNFLNSGVDKAICIGCCIESSRDVVELSKKYDSVYCAIGVHPSDCDKYDEQIFEDMIKNRHEKVVAIGEIGLDYYWTKDNKEEQKRVFDSQIKLAKKYNLPIVIHCRDAFGDTLEVLEQNMPLNNGVVFHCYSGSWQFAERLLKMGVKFSFTGTVTYKNAKNVQEVASNLPLDSFFFETDSPYLTPVPYRGERNEPKHVVEVCKFVANLRGMEYQELEKITDENAKKFFKI
jgi:TatD DNase family protein